MKLSEITKKKDFLNTLKNPRAAHIRGKIKELHKAVGEWGWKVFSEYDEDKGSFTIDIRSPHDQLDIAFGKKPDNKLQIYHQIDMIFPSHKYQVYAYEIISGDISFWVSENYS